MAPGGDPVTRAPTLELTMRRCALALLALTLLVAGCSSDGDDAEPKATTSTTAARASSTTVAEEADLTAACAPYATVGALLAATEDIATGSNPGQVAAEEQLAAAVSDLEDVVGGTSDEVDDALATVGEVTFQVSEEPVGPDEADLTAALATIDDLLGAPCADTGECPAPETLEAQGLQCDDEGNLTPVDGTDSVDEPVECPAPETLEAEGYTCDAEGNLTPVAPAECPAPETLEAEGYTCDSEGNLTPIDGSDVEGGGQVEECPAPEVLEAEGYTCDSEGNLTPIG